MMIHLDVSPMNAMNNVRNVSLHSKTNAPVVKLLQVGHSLITKHVQVVAVRDSTLIFHPIVVSLVIVIVQLVLMTQQLVKPAQLSHLN